MSKKDTPIDIKELLRVAFDDVKPSIDMTEAVLSRLAAITTVIEFGRLVGIAPIDPFLHNQLSLGDDKDGE